MFIEYDKDELIYTLNAKFDYLYDNIGDGNEGYRSELNGYRLVLNIYAYENEVLISLYKTDLELASLSLKNIEKIKIENENIFFYTKERVRLIIFTKDYYKIIFEE